MQTSAIRGLLRRAVTSLCWAVGVAALVMNVFLVRQNRDLRSRLATSSAPDTVSVGTSVPPLVGTSLAGMPLSVDTRDGKQGAVVLVFSPLCEACDRNWKSWDELLRGELLEQYRVVGVDLSGGEAPEYARQHGLDPSTVLTSAPPIVSVAYKLRFHSSNLPPEEGASPRRVDRCAQ